MKSSSRGSLKLKKRWFLLTHSSLDYYRSAERHALKLGTLVLNSLCSVVQPDDKTFQETGEKAPPTARPLGALGSDGRRPPVCPRLLDGGRARTQTLVPPVLEAAEGGGALGRRHPERHRRQGAHRHAHPAAHPGRQGQGRGAVWSCDQGPVGC